MALENEDDQIISLQPEIGGDRIDSWLSGKLENRSRTFIKRMIDEGRVLVNDKIVKNSHKIRVGDEVCVRFPPPEKVDISSEKIDLNVVYEDADIIVINKPKGMVVHPAAGNRTGTLVNALLAHCGNTLSDINGIVRPGIVHRIDKDTTGVLVVAKNNKSHVALSKLFKTHNIKREYTALVNGTIREQAGTVDAPLGRHETERKKMAVNLKNGRIAVTHFTVLERFEEMTLVQVTLETGRTHQIRVHMAYIGHPVAGDPIYGKKHSCIPNDGQYLHAGVLGFIHPGTENYVEFHADIPDNFKKVLESLRCGSKNKMQN